MIISTQVWTSRPTKPNQAKPSQTNTTPLQNDRRQRRLQPRPPHPSRIIACIIRHRKKWQNQSMGC